ncbi:hypothetical protein PFLUV_G00246430 [Perca fluviatilis]|uniref:LITAF domain-containing protein n=1 Tax=Perca fluviatilis TaxID=8168 RepID=A0A6A5DPU3_PERFL|nr:uncharacterized protein LOC120551097 [Perca fluviatilis]KAF1374137.1 hypothetical protein PFLUV_G00246430 [Perca fluviatilis]
MDQDQVLPQSFRLTESIRMNTNDDLDPEQEQQDDSVPDIQPESNQGTLEPRDKLPLLDPEQEQQDDSVPDIQPESNQGTLEPRDKLPLLDPEQKQQDDSVPDTQPKSNQGTSEPRDKLPPLAYIESRMKQLHNRRFLLLKMQRFKKKPEENGVGTTEEMTCEHSDQLCELEAIQKELEELLVKKEVLEKTGNRSKFTEHKGQQDARRNFYKSEIPRGGIYMLPPPQLELEERKGKAKPVSEKPTGPVVPVESLVGTPAVTKCPSCEEIVFTETSSRVGEATWTLCFLCTIMGCVAGCCLIPLFMSSLKDVHHQCPNCQAKIHTHQPF